MVVAATGCNSLENIEGGGEGGAPPSKRFIQIEGIAEKLTPATSNLKIDRTSYVPGSSI